MTNATNATNITNGMNVSDIISMLPIEDGIYLRYGISILILILTLIIAKIAKALNVNTEDLIKYATNKKLTYN